MAENEKTLHYGFLKPNPANFVSDEVSLFHDVFDALDELIFEVVQELEKKIGKGTLLQISDIESLTDELNKKMAASKTFKLVDMEDVKGTENALDNYILTKNGAEFVLRSALAVLGAHGHAVADVDGLQAILNTLVAGTSGVADGEITLFQGVTGKALRGSGMKFADLILSLNGKATLAQLNAQLATFAETVVKRGIGAEVADMVGFGSGNAANPFMRQPNGSGGWQWVFLAPKTYVDEKIEEFASKQYSQVFTASGTWTKPTGFKDSDIFLVEVWGAGGGGGNDNPGGGGGGYKGFEFRYADLPGVAAVVVGAGGGVSGSGGDSSFNGDIIGYGGQGGWNGGSGAQPGAGGGLLGRQTSSSINGRDITEFWEGAHGSRGLGRNAIFGGGGGGGSGGQPGGTSLFGGNGGAQWNAGTAPGGGGGRGASGARGEVRITKL